MFLRALDGLCPELQALNTQPIHRGDLMDNGTTAKRPVSALFINTDQQRFDAMSCAGNDLVTTPRLYGVLCG